MCEIGAGNLGTLLAAGTTGAGAMRAMISHSGLDGNDESLAHRAGALRNLSALGSRGGLEPSVGAFASGPSATLGGSNRRPRFAHDQRAEAPYSPRIVEMQREWAGTFPRSREV